MGGVAKTVKDTIGDVGNLVTHPSLKSLENVGHDILPIAETAGLTAAGVPLPASAAIVGGGNTLARGGNIGQALTSSAEDAAFAYGGQQIAGAAGGTPSSFLPDSVNNALSSIGTTVSNAVGDIFGNGGEAAQLPGGSAGADTFNPIADGATVSAPATAGTSGISGAGLTDAEQNFLKNAVASSTSTNPALSTAGSTAGGGIMSFLKNNASLLLPAGALGIAALKGNQVPKGQNQLEQAGANALSAATGLVNSEASGTLPPGQQSIVDQQLGDAITSIKSKYASMGLSGSTMEAQEIQTAKNAAVQQAATLAQQATQTGLSALGTSGQIYQAIMNSTLNQDQELSNSIANLAGSTAKLKAATG